MMRRACLALAMALSCTSVSAKSLPLPMPLAAELPVEVVLSQHELAVDVPNTANAVGAQFGLIGMLIGSGIQNAQVKRAEEQVVPLRNLLLEYRFNERVEAALRAGLASEGISLAPSIRILQTPWDAVDAQQDKQGMPLHAMVIVPRYAIDSGFTTLSVSLSTQIVDRTLKANGKVKTRSGFMRNYAFHFPLMGADGEGNPQHWADLGSARLDALLDQGITQATAMLVYDFSAEGRTQWGEKVKRQSAMVKGITYPGLAVRQTDDWVWVRNGGTFLMQTLAGYQPVAQTVATAVTAAIDTPAASPTATTAQDQPAAGMSAATPSAPLPATPEDAAPAPAAATTTGGR